MAINVLIIDESAVTRQALSAILSSDSDIEIIGTLADSRPAGECINSTDPDVLIIGLETARMDGLIRLENILANFAVPIIVISTQTESGIAATLGALELGVADYIDRPTFDMRRGFLDMATAIIKKTKAAADMKSARLAKPGLGRQPIVLPGRGYCPAEFIIGIGASCGTFTALQTIIHTLPADSPAILVVQHVTAHHLTENLVAHLNRESEIKVCAARHDQPVLPGHVYFASGNRHMRLAEDGDGLICRFSADPPVCGYRPSIDVLFNSIARVAGFNSVGVTLAGVERDGANGLLAMQNAGALTLAQDQRASVSDNMTTDANGYDGAVLQVSPEAISATILQNCCRTDRSVI